MSQDTMHALFLSLLFWHVEPALLGSTISEAPTFASEPHEYPITISSDVIVGEPARREDTDWMGELNHVQSAPFWPHGRMAPPALFSPATIVR